MPNFINHSIIIPIYNAPREVSDCFTSIAKAINFAEVELILIDDASQLETKELIQNFVLKNPEVQHIVHAENCGYLATVNEGLSLAKGDVITLLNSDTTIPNFFSKRVLDCFNHKENIGVASPILAKGIPFSIPLLKGLAPQDVDKMDKLIRENKPLYPTIIFPDGACFSISRPCLEKVGYFDSSYQSGYFEELDFSMRAVEQGFSTVFIDNLYVYHRSHASFSSDKTKELMARNKKIFMEKWGNKYLELYKFFPKSEHKKRIYSKFYPLSYYYYTCFLLKLSKFIPITSLRRKIRQKYQ